MSEESKVSIDLKEYKEFIVSQYETGKYKDTLQESIKQLEKRNKFLEQRNAELLANTDAILELGFKRHAMGSDTRSEQTNIKEGHIGPYAGYHKNDIETLESLGFTRQDLKDYINKQWDIREEKMREEKEDNNAT